MGRIPQLDEARERHRASGANRPFVTASWAQSLDGCLSHHQGERTRLSSDDSLVWTHGLRARHDVVMVGIGTVLCDDPLLTTRLVEGPCAQPVLLDTHLRIPLAANLVQQDARPPWIITGTGASSRRVRALEESGCVVLPVEGGDDGLNLEAALSVLHERGVESIMVEGGARLLASFLRERLADFVFVTVAPRLMGNPQSVRLELPSYLDISPALAMDPVRSGQDLLLAGALQTWDDFDPSSQLRLVRGEA